MIALNHPLQSVSESTTVGRTYAEHLRRQRFFQQDTLPCDTVNARLTEILVPSDSGDELEPLVCRMD